MTSKPRYRIADFGEMDPIDCPCGATRRAFVDDPDQTASVHLLELKSEPAVHYHRKMTEIYTVLEGEGVMELDDDRIEIAPGKAVMIKPGCRHRALGNLKILVTVIPAFDGGDEFFD